MTFDLVVIGDLNPDVILAGTAIEPAYGGQERLVEAGILTLGGSGAIVATAAARLGLTVAQVAVAGDDDAGRFVLDQLRARGVNTTWCREDPAMPTGLTVALSRGGDRAMLTYAGTIAALRPDHVPTDSLTKARHVHVASYYLLDGLRDGVAALLAQAHDAGATTSLDTGWDPREEWDLGAVLAQTDVLLPNAAEACRIARTDDAEQALDALAASVPTVAVKLGERGAIARRGDERAAAGPPPTAAIDTTGAGDCFAAGFLHGYLDGRPLTEALELAVACGTLSTRALGGVEAQPTLAEALAAAGEARCVG